MYEGRRRSLSLDNSAAEKRETTYLASRVYTKYEVRRSSAKIKRRSWNA
jgi:hypothetical protein